MEFRPPCILVNAQILLEKLLKTTEMAPCCEQVKHHMREVRPPNPILGVQTTFIASVALFTTNYNHPSPFGEVLTIFPRRLVPTAV